MSKGCLGWRLDLLEGLAVWDGKKSKTERKEEEEEKDK